MYREENTVPLIEVMLFLSIMQGIALILTVLQIVRLPNIKVHCFSTNYELFHGLILCCLHDKVYNGTIACLYRSPQYY